MRSKKSVLAALALAVALAASSPVANAQRGERMDEATAQAAWTTQAKAVAKELNLSAEDEKKITDAYIASRKSHREALSGLSRDDMRSWFEASQKAAATERAALKTALSETLTDEQTARVLPVLGSYNQQWDRLVHTLAGYNLDADKHQQAMKLTAQYVIEVDAARDRAIAAQDLQGMRASAQQAKQKLDDAMASVLSADQLAKWKEDTAPRGGGGAPGGRRGGGDTQGGTGA
jgi:hypothetical protein